MKLKNPTTLTDSAEEFIHNYILEKGLRPGDHLPSEEEFSAMMGISRNITREALSRIKSYGHIVSRRKGGMVVSHVGVLQDFSKILFPQLMDEAIIADVLELRMLLEEAIAPILMEKITPSDVDELEHMVERDTMNAYEQSDVNFEIMFHTRVFRIVGNGLITGMQEAFLPVYLYVCEHQDEFTAFNYNLEARGGKATHRDIVTALKKKDLDEYKSVIYRHLYAYKEFVEAKRNQ